MSLPFSYGDDPLPEGSIRLLRILPDTDEHSPIQCQLFECTLLDSGSSHPYEALSYVWGSEDKPRSISIGSCDLTVGVNLRAALSHLRDRFVERIMWVDAICIDQGDSKEKAHQVQSMAKIYAKANRVTVWLGEAAVDSDQALEEIRRAADEQSPKSPDNETAILTLLQRPWFQRIWVLQEVAAARHVLIKCGPAEIDGYAFCSGLSALKLSYDTCPGLQALIGSVTYLIRGAIFRPRYVTSQTGRFSLDIRPLSELVELYHARKATKRHDKVYALLGMSSDPSVAELSVNYDMPWAQLFQQLVNFFVSEHVSVDTWDNKEMAVMKGKGCVLGEVSSVERDAASDREILVISWKQAPSSRWTFQALATSVQVGDAVCLLDGTSRPTIVRPYDDYWAVIRIAVYPTDDLRVTSGDIRYSELTNHDFLLVWDLDMYPDKPQDRGDYKCYMSNQGLNCSKTEPEDCLDKATRLWNVGLVLEDMKRHEEARKKLRKALDDFEKALRSMGSQELTYGSHNQREADAEKLEEVARLLIKVSGGWLPLCLGAEDGHTTIIELLLDSGQVDPNAKDKNGRTALWGAADNGRAAVVKLLLDSGQVNPDAKDKYGWTLVSWAAASGNEVVVKLLLDSGQVDPDTKDDHGWTPLWCAAVNGHDAVVKLLLESGRVDPNGKDRYGWPALSRAAESDREAGVDLPLHIGNANLSVDNMSKEQMLLWRAADSGHEAVVKLLLDSGRVDSDAKDKNRRTLLWWAANNGHNAVVKLLLDSGQVDPDAKDGSGETPLSRAADNGHEAVVKLLLDSSRVNPDVMDKNGRTLLWRVADNGHEAVVKLLLDSGRVNLDVMDKNGRTLLWRVADKGQDAVVKLLLDSGLVDPNAKGWSGETPLSRAADNGHEAVIKLLLDSGRVDPDAKDWREETPLLRAAASGHKAVIKLLLDSGRVDPDAKDKYGETPLSRAADNGYEVVVKLLLDSGQVDPDAKDKYGGTPLSRAADNGHEAVVKLLLDSGQVDPDAKDEYGGTPLSRAADNGHEAVVKLLLDSDRVDPNAKGWWGETPLWRAAARGDEAVVKLLLDSGRVDPDAKDGSGRTPLSMATDNGHEAVVKLLLDSGQVDSDVRDESGGTQCCKPFH